MFTKTEKTILDALPKKYKYIFRFASRIELIKKQRCNEMWEGMEYIEVLMKDPAGDNTGFPVFKAGTMYKGMRPNEAYTLEELGITYD